MADKGDLSSGKRRSFWTLVWQFALWAVYTYLDPRNPAQAKRWRSFRTQARQFALWVFYTYFDPRNPAQAKRWRSGVVVSLIWLAVGIWYSVTDGFDGFAIVALIAAVVIGVEAIIRRHFDPGSHRLPQEPAHPSRPSSRPAGQ